jgi:hypothetical protein
VSVSWQENGGRKILPNDIFLPAFRCPGELVFSASAERCYPDLNHAQSGAVQLRVPLIRGTRSGWGPLGRRKREIPPDTTRNG